MIKIYAAYSLSTAIGAYVRLQQECKVRDIPMGSPTGVATRRASPCIAACPCI